jgi:hypothetical protein
MDQEFLVNPISQKRKTKKKALHDFLLYLELHNRNWHCHVLSLYLELQKIDFYSNYGLVVELARKTVTKYSPSK